MVAAGMQSVKTGKMCRICLPDIGFYFQKCVSAIKKNLYKVKVVFVDNGCLFVTAPQFIHPSVAMETGVLNSLHLDAQNIH